MATTTTYWASVIETDTALRKDTHVSHDDAPVLPGNNFGPLFSGALKTGPRALPDGRWKAALATRFDRNIYILSVETSAADDAVIIAAFNAAPE